MNRKQIIIFISTCLMLALISVFAYRQWLRPTRILVVNPLPAQAAEISFNNESDKIEVECETMEEAHDFSAYDAVLIYGRGLFLDSLQMKELETAAQKGVKIYTNALRNFSFVVNHNLDSLQIENLDSYFRNPCKTNYINLLKYVRSFATPSLLGSKDYDSPAILPSNLFYHLEAGNYFESADQLTYFLKSKGLYHEKGLNVAFISGLTFPVEGNRAHIDTLISRLTREGYNVYPFSGRGERRADMIRQTAPDAVVYLPMGRLGNDSLINYLYDENVPLFMPFPLIQSREEWLRIDKPMSGGTLNARIVVPEIDGAMAPLCISTQNPEENGFLIHTPETERIEAFMEQFTRFMSLKDKNNREKRIAIAYFKSPGKDALLASGMEVVPSLYNFLKRLREEGYDVRGLPSSLESFRNDIIRMGSVMGDYAPAAQRRFMEECSPVWIHKDIYEKWAKDILLPEKYEEVVNRYGKAPGSLLARGDSIAIATIQYGNVLLFPQPRPALGKDEFKLVHGVDVVPPHSYLAPYMYMQKHFDADFLIHFGTHGNLEFTPGKNAALSQADWAEVLIGNRPHFYFYTTGNVGEAVIAKRRSHAVIVTHLTPPYVESGLRQKYTKLIEELHEAIGDPAKNSTELKRAIISHGFNKDLELDSTATGTYSADELKKVDSFVEELANEKITGAYYVMGQPYSSDEMENSVMAIAADHIAYRRARTDYEIGKISEEELHDFLFVSHHYLPQVKKDITAVLSGQALPDGDLTEVLQYRQMLKASAGAEIDAMIGAMNGVPVRPAPGGDPVLNPNVLPMGRNMYSINAEATPAPKAWKDGVTLAEQTLKDYYSRHGAYPRKVSYTFWAGEFICSQGATVAQALRMLGVEPVRDDQGRVMDLKLTPSSELGRPRINIMVQVSGQLRDIAGSRLKLLTDAVALAAGSKDDNFPNYVAEGTLAQEKELMGKGESPQRARELSNMRIFGPVNSGYSTGMLRYTESSGEWDDSQELAKGYLNNMCAMYGDDDNWGEMDINLLKAAIADTEMIVQPRQSNTWGPISLDHVYEFTGALSLAAKSINGQVPDAVMADYRNPYLPRLQSTKDAVAIETRATILNPEFIKERMKGDATSAQMFGEIFRNIFGWSVTRPDVLPDDIYDQLYRVYVDDSEELGVEEYFARINPASLQEMTATMLESARKGFWKTDGHKIEATAQLHARLTEKYGAPCTDFVCGNEKLQAFTASRLEKILGEKYLDDISKATSQGSDSKILKEDKIIMLNELSSFRASEKIVMGIMIFLLIVLAIFITVKKRRSRP